MIVRTREAVSGAHPGLREVVGAVALMVGLLSCHPSFPGDAPFSSYRGWGGVRAWGYGQAMRALRGLVSETGGNPEEYALHSMRIRRATALAAGGSVSRESDPERSLEVICAQGIHANNGTARRIPMIRFLLVVD